MSALASWGRWVAPARGRSREGRPAASSSPHSSTVEMTSNPAHMVKLEQPAEENAAAVKTLSASADVPPSTKAQNKKDQRKEAGRQRRAARKAAQDAAEAANDDEKTDDY